jgi:hypothetical protein
MQLNYVQTCSASSSSSFSWSTVSSKICWSLFLLPSIILSPHTRFKAHHPPSHADHHQIQIMNKKITGSYFTRVKTVDYPQQLWHALIHAAHTRSIFPQSSPPSTPLPSYAVCEVVCVDCQAHCTAMEMSWSR